MGYDYQRMMEEIESIRRVCDIDVMNIGKSVMQRDVPCLIAGKGSRKVMLNGAHHGLEYLTASFLVRFAGEIEKAYEARQAMYGFDIGSILDKCMVYIVPMVNPDGVDIAVNGLDITNPYHRKLISQVGIHSFHEVWQANAEGVDINHNYNAGWKMVMDKPSPTRYGGMYPESEPETRAVAGLIRRLDFELLIAFHSQGGEIYYDFDGMTAKRSCELAQKMALESGYAVARPEASASFGGCKDWFIKEYGREGFTVEIGHGKNPLPMDMFNEIYEENARLVLRALCEL